MSLPLSLRHRILPAALLVAVGIAFSPSVAGAGGFLIRYQDPDKVHGIAEALGNYWNICSNQWTRVRIDQEGGSDVATVARGTWQFVEVNRSVAPGGMTRFPFWWDCPDLGYVEAGAASHVFHPNVVRFWPLVDASFTGEGTASSSVIYSSTQGIFSCPPPPIMVSGTTIPLPQVQMSVDQARLGGDGSVSTWNSGGTVQIDSCEMLGIWTFELGEIFVSNTVIDRAIVQVPEGYSPSGVIHFSDCVFRQQVLVEGDQEVVFEDCEFLGGVSLDQPENKVFRDCVFVGPLDAGTWYTSGGADGFVAMGCSFIGGIAATADVGSGLFSGKLPLESCYFGEYRTPQQAEAPGGFLGNRMAEVSTGYFDLVSPARSGRFPASPDYRPSVAMMGWTAGQNTMPHDLGSFGAQQPGIMKHRETLISVDLMAGAQRVEGVVVHAEIDGTRYSSPPVSVYRDLNDAGDVAKGKATANIILPPQQEAGVKYVDIILDTSGATPSVTNPPEQTIVSQKVMLFQEEYARKLNVEVYPVRVFLRADGEAPFNRTASAGRVANEGFLVDLPAKLPIATSDIEVAVKPRILYTGPKSHIGSTAMLNGITGTLAFREYLGDVIMSPGRDISLVTAVMPTASLGNNADGVVQGFRSGLLFIDENKPTAVIHELGHVFGLNRALEQYNDPRYWGLGIHVTSQTAFVPESGVTLPLNGDRIRHYGDPKSPWFVDQFTYDVMGAVTPNWPISSSYSAFADGLRDWLGTKGQARAPQEKEPAARKQFNYDRKLFFFATVKSGPGNPGAYRIEPEDISLFDVTGSENVIWPQYRGTIQKTYDWYYDTAGGSAYWLDFLSLDGQPVTDAETGELVYQRNYPFAMTVAYPEDAVRLRLVNSSDPTDVLVDLERRAVSAPAIVEPAPGAQLGDTLSISFAPAAAKDAGGQTIQHLVLWSPDGQEWQPVEVPVTETALIDLPTDFLPSGNNLHLKVISSNGFESASSVVSGLSMPNRPPSATIVLPRSGDEAVPGTPWTLEARAWDPEDQMSLSCEWSSSRDGLLASTREAEVTLSPGSHEITCRVTDSEGLEAVRTVGVTVANAPDIDLALLSEELMVRPHGIDMNTTLLPDYDGATSAVIQLRLRNQGRPVTAQVSLKASAPGAKSEQLLKEEELVLAPFGEAAVSTSFVPVQKGEWTITGSIQPVDLPERDPGNNQVEQNLKVIGKTSAWRF